MADRPILFSAPMVRALLAGRKTQTRRLLPKPEYYGCPTGDCPHDRQEQCNQAMIENTAADLRFAVGDRLWVKETWACHWSTDDQKPSEICSETWSIRYFADDHIRPAAVDGSVALPEQCRKKRVSIFMPRWASRLTLTVTDVRVERLNDCTQEDALAEGVIWDDAKQGFHVPGVEHPNKDFPYLARATAREMYAALWDTINGSGEWLGNPWIVAVSFSVERRNIDAL